MGQVFVTTYELIGRAVEKAKAFYAEADAARDAQWAWAESLGGSGFRPSHDGGVRTVFFTGELPTGWRSVGRERGKTEAAPRRSTKSGKAADEAMAALPKAPRPNRLAAAVGYSPNEMAMDGDRGVIYFPTELHVSQPTDRYFVRLPRFERDGFTPDERELRAIPESELMKALEDHNAEAKRLREKQAA